MFAAASLAIATLLNIAATLLWSAVSGIVGSTIGVAVLVVWALSALFMLYRIGARKKRPGKGEAP